MDKELTLAQKSKQIADKYHEEHDEYNNSKSKLIVEIQEKAKKGEYSMILGGWYKEEHQNKLVKWLESEGFKCKYIRCDYNHWEISWK